MSSTGTLSQLRRSVAVRLSLWFTVLFAIGFTAVFALLYVLLGRQLEARESEALQLRLRQYADIYEARGVQGLDERIDEDSAAPHVRSLFRAFHRSKRKRGVGAGAARLDRPGCEARGGAGWLGWLDGAADVFRAGAARSTAGSGGCFVTAFRRACCSRSDAARIIVRRCWSRCAGRFSGSAPRRYWWVLAWPWWRRGGRPGRFITLWKRPDASSTPERSTRACRCRRATTTSLNSCSILIRCSIKTQGSCARCARRSTTWRTTCARP
jgi:hypothetical protein